MYLAEGVDRGYNGARKNLFGHAAHAALASTSGDRCPVALSYPPRHVVRGGNPSFHDRMLAGRFGLVAVDAVQQGLTDVMTAWRTTVPGGAPTDDPTVQLFRIKRVLEETDRLQDGTSDVTRRRLRRMEEIQGALAL